MKTLFKSQDLWDLIETGFTGPDEEQQSKENRKKDAMALFFLQQAIHETMVSRIAAVITSRQGRRTLQTKFQGSSKLKIVKLQTLWHEFEF